MENNLENVSLSKTEVSKKNFLFEVSTFSKILAAIVFITLPFVGFYIGMKFSKEPVSNLNSSAPVAPQNIVADSEFSSEVGALKSGNAVLIYTETVSTESSQGRTWPIQKIWKKVADNTPQHIATVGSVGEYPAKFAVSPDKKHLAINLESKLVTLNLDTNELKTIFLPKEKLIGKIAFSPDSTRVAVVESNFYTGASFNALYSVDIKSGVSTLLDEREEIEYLGIEAWRPDDKLILYFQADKGGAPYKVSDFDLVTKSFSQLITTGFGNINTVTSADGMWLVQSIKSVKSEVCKYSDDSWWIEDGDFRASFPSEYEIIDPITKSRKGTITAPGKIIEPIAFSGNGEEVLYRMIDLPLKTQDCSSYLSYRYPAPYVYYTKHLVSGQTSLTENYKSNLANWRANTINAVEKYDEQSSDSAYPAVHIEIDGNVVAASAYKKPIAIIAQYYE